MAQGRVNDKMGAKAPPVDKVVKEEWVEERWGLAEIAYVLSAGRELHTREEHLASNKNVQNAEYP